MVLALPGARSLFSHMQDVMASKVGARVALRKGVHQALEDFRWLLWDITSRPTRIAELVPMLSSAEGHHDASGEGAGGVWFPADHLAPPRGHDRSARRLAPPVAPADRGPPCHGRQPQRHRH